MSSPPAAKPSTRPSAVTLSTSHQPLRDGAPAEPKDQDARLVLTSRVVSLKEIESRLDGLRTLVVPPGAVITPAAREALENRRVAVERSRGASAAANAAATLLVAVGTDPQPLSRALKRAGLAIETETLDCLIAACDRVATAVRAAGARAILLTPHAAVALCLANRQGGVRAILGSDADAATDDAAAVGANLLVLAPGARGPAAVKQTAVRFLQGPPLPCPEALRARLG